MEKKTQRHGMNFLEVLLIVFVALKLTGVIDWSWWWVLSPFWIPVSILVLLLLIYGILKRL